MEKDFGLKGLVEALRLEKEGNEEILRRIEKIAVEQNIPTRFWLGNNLYDIDRYGPNASTGGQDDKWDVDHEPVSASEYLAALKDSLLRDVTDAKAEGDNLTETLRGFIAKQVTFRELKSALEG